MSTVRSRLASRAGGNVVDQGLSALSNVLLAVVVARSVSPEGFGAFSIAFVGYGIAVAVAKSLIGQPAQIRFAAANDEDARTAFGRALGCAVLLSGAALLLAGSIGLILGGLVGQALLALAVVLPALLLQDCCRMLFFALGRPWSAAAIDGLWAVIAFAGLGLLLLVGVASVPTFLLCWGVGAAGSAVLGLAMLKVAPRVREWRRWVGDVRDLSGYLLAEYVLGLGAMQLSILLMAVIASASAVGSVRGAQVLLGPLAILGVAAFQFAVPEVARRQPMSARGSLRFATGMSAVLGAVTLGYVVVLLVVPDRLGNGLLGATWVGVAAVILPMGLSSLFSSLANGFAGVLYGMGRARSTFRINVVKGPFLVIALLLGTWQFGAVGAAWAMAVTEAAVLPAWIMTLVRAVRSGRPAPRHAMVVSAR